ncbi:MAG: hypothetical protein DLM70_13495 [Chloroflexi bacterium]|nr:MAG: hypothetical protein DLM70_13495 [Chloroflexota bacterium]
MLHRRATIALIFLSLVSVGAGCTLRSARAGAQSAGKPIALGAVINDPEDDMVFANDYVSRREVGHLSDGSAIDRYSAMVRGRPSFVAWYEIWGRYEQWPARLVQAAYVRGIIPMITWMPTGDRASAYAASVVASGKYDSYVRSWARAARQWGHPFLLRFAHEMNGNWYPWGTGPKNFNHNTPSAFVAEWRHVHKIFTSAGAINAIWVWSPNVIGPNSPSLSNDYPGDAYVDWTALDGYNRGAVDKNGRWRTFSQIFGPSYHRLTSLSRKPIMVAELGSAEKGGDKARWMRNTFLRDLPTSFPRVRAVTWFNANERTLLSAKNHPPFADHRVNSTADSLNAWRDVVTSPMDHGDVLTPTPVLRVKLTSRVAPGGRQLMRIHTRIPRELVHISVDYPNGDRQSAAIQPDASGHATYSFVQGSSKIRRGDLRANVIASLGAYVDLQSYTVLYGRLDVSVEPREQHASGLITISAHATPFTRALIVLKSGDGSSQYLTVRTGKDGWASVARRVSRKLKGAASTKIIVSASASYHGHAVTTQSFFTVS